MIPSRNTKDHALTGDQAAKVLILGADGFIGRHLAFACRNAGFSVLCVARNTEALAAMGFATLQVDFTDPSCHDPAFWRDSLLNVDHVVNAAGLLSGSKSAFEAVHVLAPKAVYAALQNSARSVLISAVGLQADTDFARYRLQGEAVAAAAGTPVAVLRCGLVLAATSYGGSSLIRALSALPVMPVLGDGQQAFNPIHADDLAQVVLQALTGNFPPRPVDVGGPETLSLQDLQASYRAWLGLRAGPVVRLPLWLARFGGVLGDVFRFGPISSTAVQQVEHSVLADTTELDAISKTTIRPFQTFLFAQPAGTQDLWQARLYLLRPLVRLVLALMWLGSGLIGLFLAPAEYLHYFQGTGLPDSALVMLAKGGGLVDLGIAFALFFGWRLRLMAGLQLTMVGAYTLGLTALAPSLWLLPLGGLLKNLPILMVLLIHRILEQER